MKQITINIISVSTAIIFFLGCIDLAIDVYNRKVDTAKLALQMSAAGIIAGYMQRKFEV